MYCKAGGWRKAHPLPADKGRFATFNQLFQENQQIVRDILENDHSEYTAAFKSTYDEELLKKLRDLYTSCIDEDTLDQYGESPLRELSLTVKKLFRGRTTDINRPSEQLEAHHNEDLKKKTAGLTAAVSFLHTRGMRSSHMMIVRSFMSVFIGIPGLFDLGIEGDAAGTFSVQRHMTIARIC